MTNKDIIDSILYALSFLLPSIIAILTLVKKTYFKTGIKNIEQTIIQFKHYTDTRFSQLSETLLSCQSNIKAHNEAISKYLQQQSAASRIRDITKHALEYCGDRKLAKIIDKFTQQTVAFTQYIIEIGFQNTTREQIIAKLTVARQTSLNYLKSSNSISQAQYNTWVEIAEHLTVQYLKDIIGIYQDVVNNKNSRFLTTTQDAVQKGIRSFILFAAKLDDPTRRNVFGDHTEAKS